MVQIITFLCQRQTYATRHSLSIQSHIKISFYQVILSELSVPKLHVPRIGSKASCNLNNVTRFCQTKAFAVKQITVKPRQHTGARVMDMMQRRLSASFRAPWDQPQPRILRRRPKCQPDDSYTNGQPTYYTNRYLEQPQACWATKICY